MHSSRALAAVLTTTALAAPTAATARPAEPIPTPTPTAHASAIRGQARIYVQPRQIAPAGEQAAARSVSTQSQPSAAAPAADAGHHGIDWATLGLGIAGSLVAFSGITAVNNRRSRRHRAVRAAH
jgi:hypothetical protein